MDLDITIHKGRPGKPVVIFIHGLGVEKGFWTDPVNTKVLGRSIPMKVFAAKKPRTRSVHAGMKLTAGIMPAKTENLWIAVNRHNSLQDTAVAGLSRENLWRRNILK
jgi:hypothetical protein